MGVARGAERALGTARDANLSANRDVAKESRKQPGCIRFVFSEDIERPGSLRIFEAWESYEALAAHFNSAHMNVFRSRIGGLVVTQLTLQRVQIASE